MQTNEILLLDTKWIKSEILMLNEMSHMHSIWQKKENQKWLSQGKGCPCQPRPQPRPCQAADIHRTAASALAPRSHTRTGPHEPLGDIQRFLPSSTCLTWATVVFQCPQQRASLFKPHQVSQKEQRPERTENDLQRSQKRNSVTVYFSTLF